MMMHYLHVGFVVPILAGARHFTRTQLHRLLLQSTKLHFGLRLGHLTHSEKGISTTSSPQDCSTSELFVQDVDAAFAGLWAVLSWQPAVATPVFFCDQYHR